MNRKSILYLENGEVFNGLSFGYEGETAGEIVFNTSMTGYQEIITDPSYNSQIVLRLTLILEIMVRMMKILNHQKVPQKGSLLEIFVIFHPIINLI